MSGILDWASGAFASVIAPFVAERDGTDIDYKPPPRNSFNNPKAKKRALAKKKAARSKRQAQQLNTTKHHRIIDLEPDEHTRATLAKMAEAVAEREKAEKEAEREALERLAEREKLLENSVVKNLPVDPLAEERREILREIDQRLNAIGVGEGLCLEDFQERIGSMMSVISEVESYAEEKGRSLARACPRVPQDKADYSIEDLRDQIQALELSEEPNSVEVKNLVGVVTAMISQKNNREFQERLSDVSTRVSLQRGRINSALDKARLEDARQRAMERLKALYESLNDAKKLVDQNVIDRGCELKVDYNRISPYVRKIERKFRCVLTPPRNRSRSLRVWGHEEDVGSCCAWIETCDWSGSQMKNFDRRMIGIIVGRSGTTIQQIEKNCDCILNLDNKNNLTVFGPPSSVQLVWTSIENLQKDQIGGRITTDVPCDSRIARAISAQHRSKIGAIEERYGARINVLPNPDDQRPRLIIRAPADNIPKVKLEVERDLIGVLTVLEFKAHTRAIARLMVSQKLPGRASSLNNDFRIFRSEHGLFVCREGAPESEENVMIIVCTKDHKDEVKEFVETLLTKADYLTERISIMREQQRIFNMQNRKLIEDSSGCQVYIVNQENSTQLSLVGTESQIADGKKIVADILDREGAMEVINLKTGASVERLLRDRGSALRNLENLHAVSIRLDRGQLTAKIVGDRTAIQNAIDEIRDLERDVEEANADTAKLVIKINGDRVPILIGTNGNTIQQIRAIPGIQSIEVPNVTAADDTVEVVVVGRSAALDEAQSFIRDLISRDSRPSSTTNEDYAIRARGRGRGRRRVQDSGQTQAVNRDLPASAIGHLLFEESVFPALETIANYGDA